MEIRKIEGFGVGYGFICDASEEGGIIINAKALAKIEPGGEEAIREMQRRANAYPELVAALRMVTSCRVNDARGVFTGEFINARLDAAVLLAKLGEV